MNISSNAIKRSLTTLIIFSLICSTTILSGCSSNTPLTGHPELINVYELTYAIDNGFDVAQTMHNKAEEEARQKAEAETQAKARAKDAEAKRLAEEKKAAEEAAKPKEFDLYCRYHGMSQAEVDAGGIIEWEPNYYASHWYDEGGLFYEFDPGTVVHIDGKTIIIEGCVYGDYYDDYIEDTKNRVGWDKVCFQTCLGNGSEIVIYYGSQI